MSSKAESINCNAEFQSQHILTEADFPWLEYFYCQLPSPKNKEVWLEHLNHIISIGSISIKDAGTVSETQILKAREYFFSLLLDIENETLTRFKEDNHPWMMPLDTFVLTQRELFQQGIDGPTVINDCPPILGLTPESAREKLNNLASLGIDVPYVINNCPPILGLTPESARERLDILKSAGIDDVPKIINDCPKILIYTPELVKERLDNLKSAGIDVPKVINACPTILDLPPELVKERLDNLKSAGIDVPKVINACPTILHIKPEFVRKTLNILKIAGIDGPKFINDNPHTLHDGLSLVI